MPCPHAPTAATSSSETVRVSSGLNLWLELENPEKMPDLLAVLAANHGPIEAALRGLHYVHFARFVPTRDRRALQVITEFDGELEAYVMDFALAIGEQFEAIMTFVKCRPPSPVKDHPAEFLRFILDNNVGYGQTSKDSHQVYSAYPERTVLDIIGAHGLPVRMERDPVQRANVDRRDVQANVLRGVNALHARHFGLVFADAASGKVFLAALLEGNGAPRLSSDAAWKGAARPDYTLTLGLTFGGLQVLGISASDDKAFHLSFPAFVRGPDDKRAAERNGDFDDSRPSKWRLGGDYQVHVVVSIYADEEPELDVQAQSLKTCWTASNMQMVWERDAHALTKPAEPRRRNVHFGYADGLAQPKLDVKDAPDGNPDMQPKARVGEFLLGEGYQNIYGGSSNLGGLAKELSNNATFAALRVMKQDVAAFEDLLERNSARYGVDKEWLAARFVGRWRDGTPLSQSPDREWPDGPSTAARNNFDYAPSIEFPSTFDDTDGLRCPVGAHARRMNPRSALVSGMPHSRRLIRRGMPYGEEFLGGGDDGIERGLVGFFICADLDRQFEFSLRQWANGDQAARGISGQQDPIIGAQKKRAGGPPARGVFRCFAPDGRSEIVIEDVPRLVTTVGSAYLLMPGLNGLRTLISSPNPSSVQASLHEFSLTAPKAFLFGGPAAAATALPGLDPSNPKKFDPERTPEFHKNPFPYYAWFRAHAPVIWLDATQSFWVFTDKLIKEVTDDPVRFCKRSSATSGPAGLLNMDPPAYKECREAIEPLMAKALQTWRVDMAKTVLRQYRSTCQNKGKPTPIDWVSSFALPVSEKVFFDFLGLSVSDATTLIESVKDVLKSAPLKAGADISDMLRPVGEAVLGLGQGRQGSLLADIWAMHHFDQKSNVFSWDTLLPGSVIEHLAVAATLSMAGFLPVRWFITLATYYLLDNNGALLQTVSGQNIGNRAVVDELLRFDMSAPMTPRVAGRKTELGGLNIEKDDYLMLVYASANRDEAAFGANADVIDFTRNKGPGWGFGGNGMHYCLGLDMVYAVMEPVIQVLRDAVPVPGLQAGFAPEWDDGPMFRPMERLWVHC